MAETREEGEWTTERLSRDLGLRRPDLHVLTRFLRIRPKQEVRAGRTLNLYTLEQVNYLRDLRRLAAALDLIPPENPSRSPSPAGGTSPGSSTRPRKRSQMLRSRRSGPGGVLDWERAKVRIKIRDQDLAEGKFPQSSDDVDARVIVAMNEGPLKSFYDSWIEAKARRIAVRKLYRQLERANRRETYGTL